MANLSKVLFLSLVVFAISGFTKANAQDGNVNVISDHQLELLVNQKRIKADTSDRVGYRIQVYFGTDMDEAQKIANKVKSKYPELADQVYITYKQPYWRVRIGNYYRPIDAQADMQEFKESIGDVFLIKDDIELPRLDAIPSEENDFRD